MSIHHAAFMAACVAASRAPIQMAQRYPPHSANFPGKRAAPVGGSPWYDVRVNFFGHAVVAAWRRPEPSFALGAMLPDLAHMLGRHRVSSPHELLGQGISFHHQTDRVFHGSRVFIELEHQALRELRRAAVPPGPRRALAHVGLEVLLDAELARVPECLASYQAALMSAENEDLAGLVRWPTQHDPEGNTEPGLVPLCRVLLARSERLRPKTSADVVERLARILDSRPRLSIPASHRQEVNRWVESTWPVLQSRLADWVQELSSGLRAPGPDSTPASSNEASAARAPLPGDPA
jgi:hypothetical protein